MKDKVSSRWLKAAVAGGLWASFEIIVGSMLHNLHLPFSGTILTAFSVILMIAFMQLWKSNGVIWRSGLICGLMKSLSPSAVILGPMTGIMLEAIIMDLLIFIMGKNLFGYLAAGIGALLSAILHKLASLFILYGSDLVNIYVNLFEFLKKQFRIEHISPGNLITFIIIFYIALGSLAAIAGFYLGKSALRINESKPDLNTSIDPAKTAWNYVDPRQRFRITLFFLHLLMIPAMLLLINRYNLKIAAVLPASIYTGFLLIYYKRIAGRLKKPFFWSQLLLMTFMAGLFWKPRDSGFTALSSGFLVGIEMSMRAVIIVSAFSALSTEIRNPRITGSLLRLGMGNAHAAVSLAFNSLPVMLDRSSTIKTFIKKPVHSVSKLIWEAEWWLECYQTHLKK